MSDEEEYRADVEPEVGEVALYVKSSRKAFSKLATELSDEDLSSPGVQKMLLAEITRLEAEVDGSKKTNKKFHEVDKRCAVLDEQIKRVSFTEILHSACLTIGGALIGLSPSMQTETDSTIKWAIGIIGGILVLISLFGKLLKK